jgi:hypothetical protein
MLSETNNSLLLCPAAVLEGHVPLWAIRKRARSLCLERPVTLLYESVHFKLIQGRVYLLRGFSGLQ